MVKAILFDFWGTLVENGVWSPTKQVKRIINIKVPFSEYILRMEKAMMSREFESLSAAFESICQEFNLECREEQLDELIGMWNKSWMLAKPYEETKEVLEELSKKYELILISNSDSFSIKRVLDKYDLRKYFKQIFLSCETGLIKSDEKFMQHVLKESNLRKEDCVLVGDSLESDMTAAERAGVRGILIDRREGRNYTEKVKNLKELSAIL
jgi:putative hydrolase of the HAD superfamily